MSSGLKIQLPRGVIDLLEAAEKGDEHTSCRTTDGGVELCFEGATLVNGIVRIPDKGDFDVGVQITQHEWPIRQLELAL